MTRSRRATTRSRCASQTSPRRWIGSAKPAFEFEYPQVYDSSVCHMAFFKDPDGNALILHHRYAPYSDGTTP